MLKSIPCINSVILVTFYFLSLLVVKINQIVLPQVEHAQTVNSLN